MRVTPGLRPHFIKTHKTITTLIIFNPCEGGIKGRLEGERSLCGARRRSRKKKPLAVEGPC